MRFAKRKWGWYLTLLEREHFKVKLLRFRPLEACSLQYHNHRSELWLFLKGSGTFLSSAGLQRINAGEIMLVHATESHQYRADIKPVYVLEIQFGYKCDENDIVRIAE